LYREQGNYELAESTYKRVLKNSEQYLDKEKIDSRVTTHNLALLYSLQNKFELAEPLFDAALASLEKRLGPNHPEVAKVLKEKAVLYKKTNRETEAKYCVIALKKS
jgi:tetratricopeptide (TPR) repeat protein